MSTGDFGNILVENDKMWISAILLMPLGLAFLFLYWGATLNEEQEPLKWFMRLLSFIMIFLMFVGASIVINLNPGYESLQVLFNLAWVTWVFFSIFACVLVYLIYKVFMSYKMSGQKSYEEGELR